MLYSMTGYGVATKESDNLSIRAEVKSLNSRNLDVSIRVPRQFSEKEITLRSELNTRLERGKININIELDYNDPSKAKKTINTNLLLSYIDELRAIAKTANIELGNIMPSLLSVPDVLQSNSIEPDVQDWDVIQATLEDALVQFEAFRKREGEILEREIRNYLASIKHQLANVQSLRAIRLPKIKEALKLKLSDFITENKLDENRFEQELIYYADKFDVEEEMVRLTAHIDLFLEILEETSPGKKIGFILQEMGREINTIGSKANESEMQKSVVIMKEELEKIKEQSFNIL